MRVLVHSFLCLAFATALSAQQVIKSQTLTFHTEWSFPNEDVTFEKDAVIVTNGFHLWIEARALTGNGARIVSFTGAAPMGAQGSRGAPSERGGAGGDGERGRDGGAVVISAAKYIGEPNSLRVTLNGEDGGTGGFGGDGGDGVEGRPGDPPDTSTCWRFSCARNGGDGGDATNGGQGGPGGRGGDAGDGGTVWLRIGSGAERIATEVFAGRPGTRGRGGTGGRWARGGKGGAAASCCDGGRKGADSHPGRMGDDGPAEGRSGRNGQVIKFD